MSVFDRQFRGCIEDDSLIELAARTRVRMLEKCLEDGNGVLANTMDNRMLVSDVSADAMKNKRLKQNDRAIDNGAQNAALVSEVLSRLSGTNPFLDNPNSSATVGDVIDASFEGVFDEEIDPATTQLGNQRMSLEDAKIDSSSI